MEPYVIEKEIHVMCITAESFPDKVGKAHKQLHELVQEKPNRTFFGISRPENGTKIIYKAATEELETGEAEKKGLEPFTIKKGEYISIFIPRFCDDPQSVAKAFQKLLSYPEIDHEAGYCLEIYENDIDVRCLIPLKK